MVFEQVNRNVGKNRSDMAELQNQAATQKRVTKPSDDPVAATRVLASRIELQGSKQYQKNLAYAKSFLEFTDQSLDELTGHLVRAKELALNQASDASANDQSRRVVAEEIGQIYRQAVQIGNRKLGERYIFGGFNTTQTPFDYGGHYKGDQGEMQIHVDKEQFIAMNVPGDAVFTGQGLSRDSITYESQVQALSTEQLAEQIQKKEEKIKQQEELQTQKNTALRGPASNTWDRPEQELSIGNTAQTSQYGTNIFDVLRKIEVALKSNDKESIQDALEPIDDAISQIVLTRSTIGSRVMVLDNSMESLLKGKVDTQALISQLEDADAFEVISDINKTENTLQATLSTSGKLIQKSLMDFVR
ncbi:MAG: flagellar hook-associated protein FlgL [Bdellovibrionales bacterium]|nr:flagellar hook-associated protein FlgL [Bdellovibrionales bacterium]